MDTTSKNINQNISFRRGTFDKVYSIKNTQEFHGNMSDVVDTLLRAAFDQNIIVTFNNGKTCSIQELEDMTNTAYYGFGDINVYSKKITSKLKENFNKINDPNLKAALYNCIKAIVTYLNKIKNNVIDGPEISSALNLAIYFNHHTMLYIDVKNINNNKVHISKLLQFNQHRFQPDIPIIWNEILNCLNCKRNDDIWVSEMDLNTLTNHFLNL